MVGQYDPDVTYTVPKRFGMRTVLLATALAGVLMALARSTALPTVVTVFYSVFLAAICVSQMVVQRFPRLASIVVGAVYVPSVVHSAVFLPGGSEGLLEQVLPRLNTDYPSLWMVVIGGFLGYLAGTMLAGAFMLVEQAGRSTRPPATRRASDRADALTAPVAEAPHEPHFRSTHAGDPTNLTT